MLSFKDISDIFEKIEQMLMASLKRNLAGHKRWEKDEGFDWPAWQAEKLKHIERFRQENKSVMDEYSDVIDLETRGLMADQFMEGVKAVDEEAEAADYKAKPSEENFFGVNDRRLEKLMQDMHEAEQKAETAAIRMMDDVYRRTISQAATAMAAGATTLPQAIDMAVKVFLKTGINCIEYGNGNRVNIADYVQMALRTAATRSFLQGEAKRRAELGIDTVLVSQYGACSNTCLPWQGRVYIDDVWGEFHGEISGDRGKSVNGKWYPLLSVAVKNGLFHPNCRHTITTWFEGVSKLPNPMDTAKIKENSALEQQQRAMEKKIRMFKRLAEGVHEQTLAKEYKRKASQAQKELKEFIAEHDDVLRRDYWREKTYGEPLPKKLPDQDQYEKYKERLGEAAPAGYEEFEKLKHSGGPEWIKLQETYRYTGIVNRLIEHNSEAVVLSKADGVPEKYLSAMEHLSSKQKDGIFHYSHYDEGVKMNKFLGGVPGITLKAQEKVNLDHTAEALSNMSLPDTTVVWRGTAPELLKGYKEIQNLPISQWKTKNLYTDGFTSTSIFRDTSYNKEIQMVILVPKGQNGAGYINEISYNKTNLGKVEGGHELKEEYEVLLQKNSQYSIIEAQKFNKKTFLVVRWNGYD